ncbi:MAG: FAD binding domain-containing protein [Planctomycetota bacterium]
MTRYLKPTCLAAALDLRAQYPQHRVLAGGTDLMVDASGLRALPGVIDVFGLTEMVGISATDGPIRVGAATTYLELLASPLAGRELALLAAAAREIGALQIQARGTLGGNVATSSPVGDTLPVLLALGAEIELASQKRRRHVSYDEFCVGYRRTVIEPDELIVAIHVARPASDTRWLWRKVGARRAQAISKVMIAATARLDDAGRIAETRIALGAVADRPLRALRTERVLLGQLPGESVARAAANELATEITPIDDVRSTASYRRTVAQNLIARWVCELAPVVRTTH